MKYVVPSNANALLVFAASYASADPAERTQTWN